jgi:O-antigen/teichoic acid export membrane protein
VEPAGVAQSPTSRSGAMESLGKGTIVIVLGTLALFLLSFIGRVAVARYLNPAGFGEFNLGLAFAGLLSLVSLLGLHQATARTLAATHDPAVRRRVIRTSGTITGVAAVVASSAIYLLARPIATLFASSQSADLVAVFQLFSVTVGLTLLCTFIASVFQGFEDTIPYAWLNQAVQPGAFVIFVYIFFAFHFQLTGALIAWVISNAVTFATLVVYAWRRLPRYLPEGPVAQRMPSGLFVLSLSLWGVTTLTFVTGYVDTLILGAFRSADQVGIYSAVMTFARLLLTSSIAVTYIFLPVSARLHREGDYDTIRATYVTTTRWALLFAMPIFFVFAFLPSDSLLAVFGRSYVSGGLALAVVAVAVVVSVGLGPVNVTLAGLGATRPLLIATAASASANIVLSFTLIPTFGLLGAAVAWSVARVIYPAAGALSLHAEHRIRSWDRTLAAPLVASLAIASPIFLGIGLIHHPSWVVYPLWLVGVAIFVVSILLTRSVQEGDLVVCRIAERIVGRPLPRLERFLTRYIRSPPSRGGQPVLAP